MLRIKFKKIKVLLWYYTVCIMVVKRHHTKVLLETKFHEQDKDYLDSLITYYNLT